MQQTKKRPKLHKTQEHYASVSVLYLYYGAQEVIVLRHYRLHLIAGTAEITKIAPAINMTLTKR